MSICDTDYVKEPLAPGERMAAPALPSGNLTVENVPAAAKAQKVPLLRQLMPVVMVAAMVAMVIAMITQGGKISPMMVIFPLVMAISMMAMFIPSTAENVDETRRTYLRHLGSLRRAALRNAQDHRDHEEFCHPAARDVVYLIDTPRLWERAAEDSDAFHLRIGTGNGALCTPIVVNDPGAAEDLDPVCAVSLRHTVQAVGFVPELPVVIALGAFPYLALYGERAEDLARSLLIQLAFHHGPELVGIEIAGQSFGWTKWLPHTREATDAQFRILLVEQPNQISDFGHWHCVIALSPPPGSRVAQLAESEGLVLTVRDSIEVATASGSETLGVPDVLSYEDAQLAARRMNPYRRPVATYATNSAHSFLDVLGVRFLRGTATLDNPSSRNQDCPAGGGTGGSSATLDWSERGQARLRVPIGVTAEGTPMILDLKESALGGMGPHGLCIGATGSGKSELLRSLVVALAATHSPDDINFVLVDFKGGATFLGLERLPHTSAVITNLEEESVLVNRMHDAIAGELTRRQEVLRRAGNFKNVTDYNKARAAGAPLEPLPALVIVLDEFSELLGQHPDFADLFVAVGRLGRSLHVHVLLASQRLEEGKLRGLDSHLSYRIGLKTFSAGESRQVLGITDAYHLPNTPGAGFLKSDADTVVRFQAAYVSGAVDTAPQTHSVQSAGVELFTGWDVLDRKPTQLRGSDHDTLLEGLPESFARGNSKSTGTPSEAEQMFSEDPSTPAESVTLLDAVVDAAVVKAEGLNQHARAIWLEPLPRELSLAAVAEESGELCCAIGIIDRPYHQRQDPLVVDFTGAGGHLALCGGPQSGKTVALRSIVASLAATHSSENLRFYVLDCGGGGLSSLEHLPHVAGVAGRGDPEKCRRILDEVSGLIDEPEDYTTFLVVDGWNVIAQEFEEEQERLARIAAEGLSARVHLIVSTPRWTVVRPAVRDLIGHRLELRLTEPMDSLVDRKAQQRIPSSPGRGITAQGEDMLLALTSTEDIYYIAGRAREQGQPEVPALKMLPESLDRAALPSYSGDSEEGESGKPLALYCGVGGSRLEPVAWLPEESPHLVIIGSQGSGKSTALSVLAWQVSQLPRERARIVMIDHRRAHLGECDSSMMAAYSATTATTSETLKSVVTTMKERLPDDGITPERLAARDWWSGPDIYLFIDDVDLVAQQDLHPLIELLPHTTDIGLHLVIARKAGGIGRALYSGFLGGVKDQSPALLLLDADREEGSILGIKPVHREPGRALYAVRGEIRGVLQVAR